MVGEVLEDKIELRYEILPLRNYDKDSKSFANIKLFYILKSKLHKILIDLKLLDSGVDSGVDYYELHNHDYFYFITINEYQLEEIGKIVLKYNHNLEFNNKFNELVNEN